MTSFRLEIDVPTSRSFVLDSLTYLNATLYKLDNSSDRIQSLNLTTLVSHFNDLTWARQFPRATEANLTNEAGWIEGMRSRSEDEHRMLRVSSEQQLEQEARRYNDGASWFPFRDEGLYRRSWNGHPEQVPPVALDPKADVQHINIPVKAYVRMSSRRVQLRSLTPKGPFYIPGSTTTPPTSDQPSSTRSHDSIFVSQRDTSATKTSRPSWTRR